MNNTKNILILILGLVCAGLSTLLIIQTFNTQQKQQQLDSNITDFKTCVAAGNPILEIYPSQCKSKDGKTYTEPKCTDYTESICTSTLEYKSGKGVTVKINDWKQDKVISSPVTITGEIPGNWSFEGSFPVVLVDWDGLIIDEQVAELQGNWMTDSFVPFTVNLSFDAPTLNKAGTLILKKDNPSGLPENDDAIEIPVVLE